MMAQKIDLFISKVETDRWHRQKGKKYEAISSSLQLTNRSIQAKIQVISRKKTNDSVKILIQFTESNGSKCPCIVCAEFKYKRKGKCQHGDLHYVGKLIYADYLNKHKEICLWWKLETTKIKLSISLPPSPYSKKSRKRKRSQINNLSIVSFQYVMTTKCV